MFLCSPHFPPQTNSFQSEGFFKALLFYFVMDNTELAAVKRIKVKTPGNSARMWK